MAEKLTLRQAQEEMVALSLAEPTKSILQASDMGVGKTVMACEMILRAKMERVLIIGIKDTYDDWNGRLLAQSDGTLGVRRINATVGGKKAYADMLAGKPGIYFSGSEYLVAQDWRYRPAKDWDGSPLWKIKKSTKEIILKDRKEGDIGPAQSPVREMERIHKFTYRKMAPLDMLVFDEVHLMQNRKSLARRTIETITTDWKLAMSGTFYGNKFTGAWAVTRWLWPDLIPSRFSDWQKQWVEMKTTRISKDEEVDVAVGEKVEGAFVGSLPCYIRVEAPPVAPAQVVHVDLTPAQRQDYEDLERDLMVWLDSHAGMAPLVADLPITLRQRLRTATLGKMTLKEDGGIDFGLDTDSAKLRALGGILNYWGNQPVMIYVDSKVFAKVAVARMQRAGYSVAEWSGDISTIGRKEIKRRFMAGELQYILATIPSISTGIDGLQTVCSKIVWLNESENNIENLQAVKRIADRPGMTLKYGPFEHVKLVARNTLDEGIFSSLIRQRLSLNASLKSEGAIAA